jgi:multidrug efflux system membrane fusion protein
MNSSLLLPRGRAARGRFGAAALLALLGSGVGSSSCARGTANAAAPAPAVPVVIGEARLQPVAEELRAVGQVEAFSTVAVKSQVTGVVTAAHFREGADVRKGDLLFTIDPRPFEAALHQAQAALARDRAQLANTVAEQRRGEELFRQGILSQETYEQRRTAADAQSAQAKADEAAVEQARLNLEWCQVRAPIDGRAGAILVFPGNVSKAPDGNPLVTLTQTRPVKVAFAVPESRLAQVRASSSGGAALAVEAVPSGAAAQGAIRGELSFLDNEVDRATGTIRLKARFANEDRRLWPGEFVEVRLVLGTRPNAVVVPASAVQPGQQGPYVYVVRKDATVEPRNVRTTDYPGSLAVVESGLSAGERVVVDGQLRLVPGARVIGKPAPGETAARPSPAAGRAPVERGRS